MRLAAEYLQRYLSQPVLVQNITGGGGTIGARQVLTAAPDGLTVLAAHESVITSYYSGTASFNWRDFEPVALLFATPELVVARSDRPWRDMRDLVRDALRWPEQISWGATFGSTSHFLPAEIMYRTGARFKLVGYEGVVDRMSGVLGGTVDVVASPAAQALKQVKAGKLQVLGLAGPERDPALASIPTLHEQGIDVIFTTSRGLLAPKGTPYDVIVRLDHAVERALADPDLVQRLQEELNSQPQYLGRVAYKERLEQWDDTIRLLAENMGLRALEEPARDRG
jgi:tripartite-type tricarboxylate transporter receptor subunit TctC